MSRCSAEAAAADAALLASAEASGEEVGAGGAGLRQLAVSVAQWRVGQRACLADATEELQQALGEARKHVRKATALPPAWTAVHMLPAALSASQCAEVVAAAEAHAGRHGGWTTERHKDYPTTDLQAKVLPAAITDMVSIGPLHRFSTHTARCVSRTRGTRIETPEVSDRSPRRKCGLPPNKMAPITSVCAGFFRLSALRPAGR